MSQGVSWATWLPGPQFPLLQMAEKGSLEALQVLGLGGLALRTLKGCLEPESYRDLSEERGTLFPPPRPVHAGPQHVCRPAVRPPWTWGH